MQGQRSATGSLPDPINFDFGSTSSNMDQQIRWNNSRIMSGGADAYMGNMSQEARNFSRWSIGESSSSNPQNLNNNHDEQMTPTGWWSSISTSGGSGPRQDSQLYEPSVVASRNTVNLNLSINQIPSEPSFVRSFTNGSNVGQLDRAGGGGGDPMDCSNSSKSGMLEHRLFPSSSGAEPFASSSGSGGFLVEDDDGRSGCAMDGHGRRMSCKRKTIEGNVEQSSNSGTYFSREGNMWQSIHAASSSLNIAPQLETPPQPDPVNSRLELSMLGLTPDSRRTSGAESSQRNHRSRMNPSNHQGSLSHDPFRPIIVAEPLPPGYMPPNWDSHQTSLPPALVNPSLQAQPVASILPSSRSHRPIAIVLGEGDTPLNEDSSYRSPPRYMNMSTHEQLEMRFDAIRRSLTPRQNPPDRSLNGGGVSIGSSSRAGERDTPRKEDSSSRPIPSNMSVHAQLEMHADAIRRSLVSRQNPPDNLHSSMQRNIGSSSRAVEGSSSHPTPVPSWGSSRRHPSSSQYSRRLSEYVRRSLLSPAGSEIGGPVAGSSSVHRSVPSSSQEVVLPSGGGSHRHNQPLPRSHPSVDRQGGGVTGIPHSLRNLPGAGEGRTRLVSEIRNVLDMMRRGEGLRFEDVMVLDPSVLFGMADINDQHRDMRLDVDNMSYEELLALEERIGSVCTGITTETVAARLKRRKYFAIARSAQTEVEPCCVCQEEYKNGDDLGTLDCGHDFHTECIKQWLGQKNLCPICKTTGLAT